MTTTTSETNMAERATVTFHTTPEIKERLARLAKITRRSTSFLSNEAVEGYLAAEEEFVASVQAGIADASAGRVLTTDELKTNLYTHITKIAEAQKGA